MKKAQQPKYQDKARGMLLGLAVGDALGAPLEFLPEPSDTYIKQMGDKIEHFHENYRAPKGVWTDDTEMALCIADSLLVNEGYNSYDVMNRFRAWSEEGYRVLLLQFVRNHLFLLLTQKMYIYYAPGFHPQTLLLDFFPF